MSRIVVSLGEMPFVDDQMQMTDRVDAAVKALEPLVSSGHQLIVCHGDAKLVGMVNLALELDGAARKVPRMPFAECTAMSEGYAGFHLAQAFDNCLAKKDPQRTPTVAVLTQAIVETQTTSEKRIGVAVDEPTARKLMAETGNVYAQTADGKWQREYPVARPTGFRESNTLKDLLKDHPVIICAGGGGIPVTWDGKEYQTASAIVEIEDAAEVMAEILSADCLLLLSEDWRPETKNLTSSEARELAKTSPDTVPGLESAAAFADSGTGRYAVIAALAQAQEAADSRAGIKVQ